MKINRTTGFVAISHGTSLKQFVSLFFILFFFIFILTGILTSLKPEYRLSSPSVHDWTTPISGEALTHLLGFENHYFIQGLPDDSRPPSIMNIAFKATTSLNPDDPRSLLGRELPGFSLYDGEIIVAGEGTNYTNMPHESSPPMEVLLKEREASVEELSKVDKQDEQVETPVKTTSGKKIAYIYHTHTRESFLPYLPKGTHPDEAYHSKVNITLVGKKLGEELESRGIGAVVDQTDFTDVLNRNGWSFPKSYDASRPTVEEALQTNGEITYLFDLHRDAKRKNKTTVTINGEKYARTFFVIGGEHARYEKNKKMATDLHKLLEEKYPGLSRGVTTKQGAGTNGKFNQDLSENAILIEFGGVDNTLEELNRSASAIADVFSAYYWGAEAVTSN